MYLIYDKNTTEVKMYSEGKNEFSNPNFIEVEYSPGQEEMDKIEQNYKLFWKDKLICEKNDWIIRDEQKEMFKKLKKDLQAPDVDLKKVKDTLSDLIDLLK